MSFSPDEARFLTAHTAEITAAAQGLGLDKHSAFADRQALSAQFGDNARAVMELIQARRVLAPKVGGMDAAAGWITDSESAQQATACLVAHVRAERIAAAGASVVHDVTCSIGTEAPAMRAAGMDWLGTDIDFSRLIMARHNVRHASYAGRAPASQPLRGQGWVARADALLPVTTPASTSGPSRCVGSGSGSGRVIVADPARRAAGRRISDPAKLIPPLPDLLAAYPTVNMAIKCAPGIDYSQWPGLVSVVSVDNGVKEACLYTPGLASDRREAVVIRDTRTQAWVETITDGPAARECIDVDLSGPKAFIIEPDGAIVRAGLVRHWAARHGLSMLDPHIAFLTGEKLPEGYSGFPFIESVPLKKLRSALQSYSAGSVEILVRGVDVDPDQLRTKLKLAGDRPMAVVIARIGDTASAFICGQRVR